MKRSVLGAAGIAAVLGAAAVGACAPAAQLVGRAQGASPLPFEATFETRSDFYDRFDFGYSGQESWNFSDGITHFRGDHDLSCGGPTTSRDVTLSGTGATADVAQLFWYCAPGGDPAKGHVMTGVSTVGYNIAWFSPKPTFTAVTRVCWDINLTDVGGRKWTQVLFVGAADAARYPTATNRASGGFDLGFTAPDFRDPNGPTTGILPEGGTLAGFKSLRGDASWFQDQDDWTAQFEGGGNTIIGVFDKAARYQHCLENQPNNVVRLTQQTPNGPRTFDMPGQIPQTPVRVVFQDDNYNPPKDEGFSPDRLTWHWDNIQIQAGSATELASPTVSEAATPPLTELAASPAFPATTSRAEAELEPGGSAAVSAGNVVGFGGTVVALALLLVLWPTRARRGLS